MDILPRINILQVAAFLILFGSFFKALYADAQSAMERGSQNAAREDSSECDLYTGKWIESQGPLYTECSIHHTPRRNIDHCRDDGRSNRQYENWAWQPEGCNLLRFDAQLFVDLMRGRRILFVGDSLGNNHMESLLCLLQQTDDPPEHLPPTRPFAALFLLPKHGILIGLIMNRFLVQREKGVKEVRTDGADIYDTDHYPEDRLHLDRIDPTWARYASNSDVVVLNSGPWWAVRGHLAWHAGERFESPAEPQLHESRHRDHQIKAFKIGIRTVLEGVWPLFGSHNTSLLESEPALGPCVEEGKEDGFDYASHLREWASPGIGQADDIPETGGTDLVDAPLSVDGYNGPIIFFRSFSISHFSNGAWDTGGKCSEFTAPFLSEQLPEVEATLAMASVELAMRDAAEEVLTDVWGRLPPHFAYLNITDAFRLRGDGHLGKLVRNKGPLPGEDCYHWCLPGPIDVWNELLLEELLRRRHLMRPLANC